MSPQTERQWRPVLEQYGFIILFAALLLPVLPGGQTIVSFVFQKVGFPIANLLIG
jgi:hypothetical protein